MASWSVADEAAQGEAKELIERFHPNAVVSVERAGMTSDGTYRNMLGQDYSEGRARLDYVVREAQVPSQ